MREKKTLPPFWTIVNFTIHTLASELYLCLRCFYSEFDEKTKKIEKKK